MRFLNCSGLIAVTARKRWWNVERRRAHPGQLGELGDRRRLGVVAAEPPGAPSLSIAGRPVRNWDEDREHAVLIPLDGRPAVRD
jgi:hypothetical protein